MTDQLLFLIIQSSSTTSSSSRRTYTSTTSSSHHPLPPRPDWAVGLKPDPTLHSTHSNPRSPISPRNANGSNSAPRAWPPNQQSQAAALQSSADFPPLTSTEKRAPVVAGAWTNSSTRAIVLTAPSTSQQGNALVHHPNAGVQSPGGTHNPRLEETDRGFERNAPRATELYNPKVVKRPGSHNGRVNGSPGDRARSPRGEAVSNILIDQMRGVSLEDHSLERTPVIAQQGKEAIGLTMST